MFHLPHMSILVTHHCGKECRKEFQRRGSSQDVMRICDYSEQLLAIFTNQIKSKYYDGNSSVSIGVI